MENTIGENIRKLRQQKEMSQDRLSKESDLALNTIVKIETGDNPNPTVETLQSIANALDVSISSIFTLPLKSLIDLRKKKLIQFSLGSSAWSLDGYDQETDLNKIFLKRAELLNNKTLKLSLRTEANDDISMDIRSHNSKLLEEIKDILGTLISKSAGYIYNEKIFIYE